MAVEIVLKIDFKKITSNQLTKQFFVSLFYIHIYNYRCMNMCLKIALNGIQSYFGYTLIKYIKYQNRCRKMKEN